MIPSMHRGDHRSACSGPFTGTCNVVLSRESSCVEDMEYCMWRMQ